jgi:hypothetical protein
MSGQYSHIADIILPPWNRKMALIELEEASIQIGTVALIKVAMSLAERFRYPPLRFLSRHCCS